MPLYKTITVNKNTVVLIWKIEESYTKLRSNIILTPNCKIRLASMKSKIHRKGFLSVRQLLKVAGYETSALYYDTFGKPHLKGKNYISITHSFTFSALIISTFNVGIDIEMQRDTLAKIASKFTHYEQGYLASPNLIEKLAVIWCAKESVYKSFGMKGVSFRKHCKVIPFDLNTQRTKAWVHYKSSVTSYEITFLSFEGFMCAYAIKSQDNYVV